MVLKTSQQMVLKTVVVASTNPCKVEACRLAFVALRYEKLMSRKVFKEDTFRFIPVSSKGGVSDQPYSEEETRQGEQSERWSEE